MPRSHSRHSKRQPRRSWRAVENSSPLDASLSHLTCAGVTRKCSRENPLLFAPVEGNRSCATCTLRRHIGFAGLFSLHGGQNSPNRGPFVVGLHILFVRFAVGFRVESYIFVRTKTFRADRCQ